MKIILFIVSIFVCLSISAQKTEDVIYLKNGSIIRGAILLNNSAKLSIKTCCNNVFVFEQSEIEKIAQEHIEPINNMKEKGYVNFTSMGILLGSQLNQRVSPFSMLMEHNYRLNKHVAVGGVVGVELLNETTVPLGINSKLMFPFKGSTLFLGLSSGYSFSMEKPYVQEWGLEINEANGGFMLNSELGFIVASNSNANFYIALGYRYNELNYVRTDWEEVKYDRQQTFNRISMKIGITLY